MSDFEKIVFDTEDGEEEFYILDDTRINGVDYILVTDSDDPDAEEIDILILKDIAKEGEEESIFEVVTDEDELKAVAPLFEESVGEIEI